MLKYTYLLKIILTFDVHYSLLYRLTYYLKNIYSLGPGIFLFPPAIFCFDRAAVLPGANDIKK